MSKQLAHRSADELPVHPYAELFPPVVPYYIETLAADIRAHGLYEPLTMYRGAVLDGRMRLEACKLAGVAPTFVEFEGDDSQALDFVLSKNLERRHLLESQRAMIAAKIANFAHGGDRRSDQSSNLRLEKTTQAQAAKRLSISKTLVQTATRILKSKHERLIWGVTVGRISASCASDALDLGLPVIDAYLDSRDFFGFKEFVKDQKKRYPHEMVTMTFKMTRAFRDAFTDAQLDRLMLPEQFLEACLKAYLEKRESEKQSAVHKPKLLELHA